MELFSQSVNVEKDILYGDFHLINIHLDYSKYCFAMEK